MASKLQETYKKVLTFASNYEESFLSLLTIVAVFVIEEVSFDVAFQCPCTHIRALWYGLAILICPALILGMLSILSHRFLWRRVKSTGKFCPCPVCSESIGRASLPFFSWIILVLIDGRIPECFFGKVSPACSNITTSSLETASTTTTTGNTSEKAIAQFTGMIIAVIYVFGVLIGLLITKKRSKGYMDAFFKEYEKQEQTSALKNLKGKAKMIAENDVETLVKKETLQPSDWIAIQVCETDNTTNRTKARGADTEASETVNMSWSGLHIWASKNRVSSDQVAQAQQDHNPPASQSQPPQPENAGTSNLLD